MSTDYKFACTKCSTTGGGFTRQMWGIGNADLVASFKFYAVHTLSCGGENIRVLNEHKDEFYDWPDQTHDVEWLRENRDVFPRASEWAMAEEDPLTLVQRINDKLEEDADYATPPKPGPCVPNMSVADATKKLEEGLS